MTDEPSRGQRVRLEMVNAVRPRRDDGHRGTLLVVATYPDEADL